VVMFYTQLCLGRWVSVRLILAQHCHQAEYPQKAMCK